jgi:hypothetical protein
MFTTHTIRWTLKNENSKWTRTSSKTIYVMRKRHNGCILYFIGRVGCNL